MRNVHSKKSLAAVVAKTAADAGGAGPGSGAGAGTAARPAVPAPSSDGPRVVVHRPEARDKVDVSQLPYMHRNPAV
jgi:hypothetical protein